MRRVLIALALLAAPAAAQDSGLSAMQTLDQAKGWEAVGRLDLGQTGFCTASLVAEDVVLTAAHCLFDAATGARRDLASLQFLAGWRNGRAAAYRAVTAAEILPDYDFAAGQTPARMGRDLALLRLDQPIRLPSVAPYPVAPAPMAGDQVGVVSYAQDRAEAPSIQQVCRVIGAEAPLLILSCSVEFGSSGAPVFVLGQGGASIAAVVSAKAELSGEKVSVAALITGDLAALLGRLGHGEPRATGSGAKFVKP